MSSSTGSVIIGILESDALLALGPQLITLLTAEGAAKGDPIKSAAAWVAFMGDIQPALIGLEGTVITQIVSALQAKLAALIAKAQAAQTPAVGTSTTTAAAAPASLP